MSDMDECTITVETVKGPVKGICLLSTLGDTFYRFRGVPFAKPPIGDLRFKDPQPIDAWTDVFDATIPGPSAMGFTGRLNIMNERCSENCLTLNVYTKNLTPKQLSPVMIWIHGGGFKYGNTAEELFGPDYLLQKNIVFVSINYRLGALGFLSIPDPSLNIPGNAGLKDQAMAFRWVRENIHAFGGDNKNITIFGSSA
ncbi:Esterase B1, partial [Pseudolycoriella hygida]